MKSLLLSLFLTLLSLHGDLSAQKFDDGSLQSAEAVEGDRYGTALSMDGDVIAIGAPERRTSPIRRGAVSVFRFDSLQGQWLEEQNLVAADGDISDQFGDAVAVHRDRILVGAYGDSDEVTSSGAAYMFRFDEATDTWIEEAKLLPPEAIRYQRFGRSVALFRDLAIIGAPPFGNREGSAYVYKLNAATDHWDFVQRLKPANGMSGDWFGKDVAYSNGRIFVGSPLADIRAEDSGAAYVFTYDTEQSSWIETEQLLSPQIQEDGRFGFSIDASKDRVVVGEQGGISLGFRAGVAHVFRAIPYSEDWEHEARLFAPESYGSTEFGYDVAIHDRTVLVGVPEGDYNKVYGGVAELFYRDRDSEEWEHVSKVVKESNGNYQYFGSSVAATKKALLVGEDGMAFGNVHIYATPGFMLCTEPRVWVAGESTSIQVRGGSPLRLTYIFDGRNGVGTTPLPELLVDADIANAFRVRPILTADFRGDARLDIERIRPNLGGRTIWLQAFQKGARTNVLQIEVQGSGPSF